jgi:hypothetical protein
MLQAVKTWLDGQVAAGGTLVVAGYAAAAYSTIWGQQDGPYPGHPYAVLQVVDPPASIDGKPARDVLNNGALERNEYDALMTVRVELLSRAPLDPASGVEETMRLAGGLEASLRTSAQNEAWSVAGLGFVRTRPPLAIPQVVGFGFERRTQLDVVFTVRVRVDVQNPFLLNAPVVSGTVDGSGNVTGTLQG